MAILYGLYFYILYNIFWIDVVSLIQVLTYFSMFAEIATSFFFL